MLLSEYRPGQKIAGTQYRFVKVLGFGGHGSVYAVEHTFLEAPAVMKLLHTELASESDLAQRMTREARTLAKLRHPNIVEVRDGGMTSEEPPRPFFVMEPLNGMSLRELVRHMKGRGIGVLPALRIMSGVFEGLHHAHSAGVIHRDIKPDNIFLHRTSTDVTIPKILDFGIAHLLLGKRFTGKSFVGTPRYAAPEQLMGETVAAPTDVYSAGLVLYELMTGRSPYHDKKDLAPLLHAHLHEKLPPVSARARDATPEVDALVDYLLEKDPARRPPTAFAAAVAVRELRTFIEARQLSALDDAGFKTEPTPIDNFLVEASLGGIELVTEEARPSSRPTPPGANRTLPSHAPPSAAPDSPPPLSPPPLSPQRTVPIQPAPPAIDRDARTRTSHDLLPLVRPVGSDTIPFALEAPPELGDSADLPPPAISYGPPSAAAIDSTTATDFAEATSGVVPPATKPSLAQRLSARPVLVFAVALTLFCGFGVPVAVTIARRYAPPPVVPVSTSTTTPLSATISASAREAPPAPPPPPPPPPAASESTSSVASSTPAAPVASASQRPPRAPRPRRLPTTPSSTPPPASSASAPAPKCTDPGDPRCVIYE